MFSSAEQNRGDRLIITKEMESVGNFSCVVSKEIWFEFDRFMGRRGSGKSGKNHCPETTHLMKAPQWLWC